MMSDQEGISVIICCYNSALRIIPTLQHLQRIKTEVKWEVILVDNNSLDNTAVIARKTWEENPVAPFKIVEEKIPGLMNARVKGVAAASNGIITFIDDDNWIDEHWVDNVSVIMKRDSSIAACGGMSEAIPEKRLPEWFEYFCTSFAVGRQQNETGFVNPVKGYLWGAGLSVRKKAWNDVFNAGFKSLLTGRSGKTLTAGEDSELCFALVLRGGKLWYDDSLKLKHFIPDSRLQFNYLIKMYRGFGKAELILAIYRDVILKKYSNKSSWLMETLSSFKRLFADSLKNLFMKKTMGSIVSWNHNRSYTLELLLNRKKYNDAKKHHDNPYGNKE